MRWLCLAASLITTSGFAKDFRALDFGVTCDAAPRYEESLGSEQLPDSSGLNLLKFKSNFFDREVTIVYLCIRGSFISGDYLFPEQTYEKVLSSFYEIYRNLCDEPQMTGQELERGAFIAAFPPARGQRVFLLGFEYRKAPNFRKIDRCSSGNHARALHPSLPSAAIPKTLSEPADI